MTLNQLATFICGKVNQNETEDVAACKTFLQRRHEMLWQESLWKDCLIEYRATLDPDADDYTPASPYIPTKGVLLLQPIIERVLAARTEQGALRVHRPEFYYTRDYDSFARTGTACDFILLPPCVWEFDEARAVYGYRGDDADNSAALTLDTLNSDGVNVDRSTVTLDESQKLLATTERIDSITKAATTSAVGVGVPGVTVSGAGTTDANGNYFMASVVGEFEKASPYHRIVDSGIAQLYDGDTDELLYTGDTLLGTWTHINNGLSPAPTVARLYQSTLASDGLGSDKRQRMRLIEIPSQETTIRVLGKRHCPTFSADNDTPCITGVENTLIAFALADMLERERQYGKAQSKFEEAGMLLDQLKRQETVQQAHNSRIIPESGYETDWFADAGKGWMYR